MKNLREILSRDMEKVREKNTAWLATLKNIFIEIQNEDEQENSEYEKWKKANADIIKPNEIKNLEKMLEHRDKRLSENRIKTLSKEKKTENIEEIKTVENTNNMRGQEKGFEK